MGVGGLLKEIETRPLPRGEAPAQPAARAPAAPARASPRLVLAAGRSRRMAPLNKLLVPDADGTPMVARVVDQVLASRARPVIVVTGHERERVEEALAGRPVLFDPRRGLRRGPLRQPEGRHRRRAARRRRGCSSCSATCRWSRAAMLDRLLAAFDPEEGRAIVQPTYRGKQGNPVLWAREFLAGDAARSPATSAPATWRASTPTASSRSRWPTTASCATSTPRTR